VFGAAATAAVESAVKKTDDIDHMKMDDQRCTTKKASPSTGSTKGFTAPWDKDKIENQSRSNVADPATKRHIVRWWLGVCCKTSRS